MTTTETGKREQSYAADKRVRARLVAELNAARERERALREALGEAVRVYRSGRPAWAPALEWEAAEDTSIRLAHGEGTLERLRRWEALLAAKPSAVTTEAIVARLERVTLE